MKTRNYILILLSPVLVLLILALISVYSGNIPFEIPENIVISPEDTNPETLREQGYVIVKATDIYQATPVKRMMQGKGYRAAWNAPIKVPVIWLDTFSGGLKVVDEGGGGQTQSLDLIDPQGTVFTLRTVAKDPSKNIPKIAKWLHMENVIMDATSAGHPYGAIPVVPMAETIGLYHTAPRLVYVPDQPELQGLEKDYGDRLYLLEYEPEGTNGDWVGCGEVAKIMESDNVMRNLLENPLHQAHQSLLLRARLFDLVIGDWDRHDGNWGWAKCPRGEEVIYEPIAADRDMAFYGISGMLPGLLTLPFLMDKFRPFEENIDYFPGMLANSAEFDPFYLNRMTSSDFQKEAAYIKERLTDEVIEQAIRTWPDTIFQLDGKEVIRKLKARRDKLPHYATMFYHLLAEDVEVMGTHLSDHFILRPAGKEAMSVEVYTEIDENTPAYPHYKRIFNSNETYVVSLFGWDEDDTFEIEGKLPDIKIQIIGGKGKDQLKSNNTTPLAGNITLFDDKDGMTCPRDCDPDPRKISAKLPREKD